MLTRTQSLPLRAKEREFWGLGRRALWGWMEGVKRLILFVVGGVAWGWEGGGVLLRWDAAVGVRRSIVSLWSPRLAEEGERVELTDVLCECVCVCVCVRLCVSVYVIAWVCHHLRELSLSLSLLCSFFSPPSSQRTTPELWPKSDRKKTITTWVSVFVTEVKFLLCKHLI